MKHTKIDSEYITLGQFLKYQGYINNGGEAKIAVKTLKITINKAPEDRRGRKIYPGDVVKIEKDVYVIVKSDEN